MIELMDIGKVYGDSSYSTEALKKVNIIIENGEMVAIMGPSGSGKTTLLHIIACMDTQTSGIYKLNNKDIKKNKDNELSKIRNTEISLIFQDFALINNSNVLENVMLPLTYRKMGYKEKKEIAKDKLQSLDMDKYANKKINQLSGGQKQRVAIARSLVSGANIILADEPTGALDYENSLIIMDILKKINNSGKTVIIVTHDEMVANCCKRLIKLKDGQVVYDNKK